MLLMCKKLGFLHIDSVNVMVCGEMCYLTVGTVSDFIIVWEGAIRSVQTENVWLSVIHISVMDI